MLEQSKLWIERSIICVKTDVCHRELRTRQLPCRSFQQQPAAHGNRRLLGHRPEDSVKLRPASIGLAGEALGALLLVERFKDHSA
jgi:hypothetical protein